MFFAGIHIHEYWEMAVGIEAEVETAPFDCRKVAQGKTARQSLMVVASRR
jgi:hypothetical protein